MNTTTERNADTIRQEIARLEGELAALAGEPLMVENEWVSRDIPPGGAVLHVWWAGGGDYAEWYPSADAARAALAVLARRHGRTPERDGWFVDLTANDGCSASQAFITRRPDGGGPTTMEEWRLEPSRALQAS